MNQPSGVFRWRTIELILSVTEANVKFGSITEAVASVVSSLYGSSAIETVETSIFDL